METYIIIIVLSFVYWEVQRRGQLLELLQVQTNPTESHKQVLLNLGIQVEGSTLFQQAKLY